MPSPRVRRGLYWSDTTRTWHFEFRLKLPGAEKSRKFNGDSCQVLEADARNWLASHKKRMADQAVGLVAPGLAPTLGEALQQWLGEHGVKKSPRHRAIVEESLKNHLTEHLHTPLPLLTTPVVNQAVADYLALAGHSAGGANVVLRALKVVVRYALKAHRIQTMPFDVKLEKVQDKPRHAMTPEDVGRLIATLDSLGAPIQALDQARLMSGLGLRVSEACLARVEATNLQRREFTPWDPEAGTKGGEAVALPIPAWLLPHITRMVGERHKGYLIQGARNHAPSRQVAWAWITRARVQLHWPWLTPHELRAAYATMLQEEGMSQKAIQELLRHKDPRTTQIYLRKDLRHAREALDRIGQKAGLAPAEPSKTTDLSPHSPRKFRIVRIKGA